jgi:hypothetical protein
MTLDDILDCASACAIANQLEPTAESTYRKICRSYSQKFNTPLHEVYGLDIETVALNVFESNLDERNGEENMNEHLLDLIYSMSDPDYQEEKSKELEEFIERSRIEEADRIKAGRPIHPSMRNDRDPQKINSEKDLKIEKNSPTGGSVDFSDLDEEEEK